jgi:dTDP-4-amino-4,6-dideoxygalactose transaminase
MTSSAVPFVDLVSQLDAIRPEVDRDIAAILSTAAFIGGEYVENFEQAYAEYCGVRHCIGVGNGTDAIELALRALDIRAGDEVILPVNTFVATAEAVIRAGATPVFVDVVPDTLLIDPAQVKEALTPRVKALIPVHLYGQMAPMSEIMALADDHDLSVVEDAAQSQGAILAGRRAGSHGHVSATSFYPGKNLGGAGDAGAITTKNDAVARRLRLLANHGSQEKYNHESLGFNSRLDAMQAAVLLRKLPLLDAWNRRRQEAAACYEELLGDLERVDLPRAIEADAHVWHLYVIRVDRRDEVAFRLQQDGIGTGIHYPQPIHRLPAFRAMRESWPEFPVAEAAADRLLSLPMFPTITRDEQRRVAESLWRSLEEQS